jgi:histidinol-phosphate aminotransferase
LAITGELANLGLRYAEPQGNFVFFDTGMPHERFAAQMKAEHVIVGRKFLPYDNWCRITVGTEPEVDWFLQSLRKVITKGL